MRSALTAWLATAALVTSGSTSPSAPEETPVTSNRLAQETSPYLLQHADNPVDWYPWGDEAFERARLEDKPIFLSIGYATCHWCHVMEHESFEDPIVASLMNEAFVNIKVDREERPDVDQVYMTVCQLLTGGGGWPLTVLMTPDRRPFFAATYLPRESRPGRVGMLDLAPRVQQLWRSDRDALLESAQQIVGHLETATARDRSGRVPQTLATTAYRQLASRFDAAHGGFGDRPKFPSPHNLLFLLQYGWQTGDTRSLAMVEATLEAMRRGGIYDHVGFGFHRYSTDREWLVPHFEKMLYDQAMMTLAYTEAFQATGNPDYRRTASEVIAYVLRDLSSPEGGLYSAEDADSEGEEGKFYLWTLPQIRSVLDDRHAALVTEVFHVEEPGNFLDEATGVRTGANILHLRESLPQAAERLDVEPPELERRIESARQALFAAREQRVHPLKDDKILADWNGLMAAALARAGRVFGDPRAADAARRAIDFVLTRMRADDGRLLHRYRAGSASIPAFLDDYAFVTWACLELYDATLDAIHLERALELADEALELFWDPGSGGLFFTGDDGERLLVRQKEVYDGAIPSGNSVAMANFVRLARLTGRADLAERADAVAAAFARDLHAAPSAHCHLVAAVQTAAAPSLEVVIAGDPGADTTRRMLEVARSTYLPGAAVLLVPDGSAGQTIRRIAPFTAEHAPIDGRAAAYVCRDFSCKLPTTDPDQLARMLADATPGRR
jgi:uncharacterized protein YyaL (SSP411 family)